MEHPLLELQEPLIYLNGKLFSAGGEKEPVEDYFAYKDLAFELAEIGPSHQLDLLWCRRQAGSFEEKKKSIAKQIQKTELQSREEILHEMCSSDVLELIVGKLLPKLTGEQLDDNLDKLLGVEKKEEDEEDFEEGKIAGEVIKELGLQNEMINTKSRSLEELFSKGHSLLEAAFTTDGFCRINNHFYQLVELKRYLLEKVGGYGRGAELAINGLNGHADRSDYIEVLQGMDVDTKSIENKINGLMVKHAGNNYVLAYSLSPGEVKKSIDSVCEQYLQVETAYQYENQLRSIEKRKKLEGEYKEIITKNEYERNGAGFKKYRTGYYIYTETGRYQVQFAGRRWNFPSATVAVHLSSNGRSVRIGRPVVLNKYKHPFLSGFSAGQGICLGYLDLGRFRNLPTEEKILANLSSGVEILKYGYRDGAHRSHSWQTNPYLTLTSQVYDEYEVR